MTEPVRMLSMSMDRFFRQTAPTAQEDGFTVIFNGVAYAYALADKVAAKAYWAGQSGFVSWWDMSAGCSLANTSTSGGAVSSPVRPSMATLTSLGGLRGYYPCDRLGLHGGSPGAPVAHGIIPSGTSIAEPWAESGKESGSGELVPMVQVAGHYDYALRGSRRLNTSAESFPTGIWTASRSCWTRRTALHDSFDLVHAKAGIGQQFVAWVNGGRVQCIGHTGAVYLFPENESDPYVKDLGAFPDDLLSHHVLFTVTNDDAGSPTAGGVVKWWLDGVLQGTFTGRHGVYFGSNVATYEFAGGYQGAPGAQTTAFSDIGLWDVDVSSLVATLAA